MARQVFIDDKFNDQCLDLVKQTHSLGVESFWEKNFLFLKNLVKEQIEACAESPEILNNLYFMGSFSRRMADLNSDLDLVCFSDKKHEVDQFNLKLREVFRNYSLKHVKSVGDFVEISDAKSLLSGWFLKSVFGGAELKNELRSAVLEPRISEIKSFLDEENKTRYKRYGERPGRINYNIKYSPGGFLDLMQLSWRSSLDKEQIDLDDYALFLYKAKSLFHVFSDSESLQLVDVNKYATSFGFSKEQDFFKKFYSTVYNVSMLLDAKKDIKKSVNNKYSLSTLLKDRAEIDEISHAEVELHKVRGVVLSPSYHVWTVDQHILTCIARTQEFIKEYEEELELSDEEKTILEWAAFFHDLRKGEKESHSILGAKAAQDFGARHEWEPRRIDLVSWLVREHLTLVKHAFKMDPFYKNFVKSLALRGCEGRRAILLFILSCADIKATNPSTWSEWKRSMLKTALDQVLGVKDNFKEKLMLELSGNQKGLKVLEGLSVKEVCMVPFSFLLEDLKSLDKEGFSFYEQDGKYWVRAYLKADEFGFAEKFMESLLATGAYIHHAVFKTFAQTEGVYNWVCVESGVSFKAFQNRFTAWFESDGDVSSTLFDGKVEFRRIRKTFSTKGYAVVSFKGRDQVGALVSAIKILKKSGLNIEWGHAVTWGEEIEDVFGVSFSESPDWTFLSHK